MAIREYNGVLSYKDKTGDTHLLYPVTKKDCVDGLEEMDAAIQAARETQRQLDAHAANRANPHGVTAEQIPCATGGTVASAVQAAKDAAQQASQMAGSHAHKCADITSGTLGVSRGGTGAAYLTPGAALVGAGEGAVTARSIHHSASTADAIPAHDALITSNTLRCAINRMTSVAAADTSYTTLMARGIKASTSGLTASSSGLASGAIHLTYE